MVPKRIPGLFVRIECPRRINTFHVRTQRSKQQHISHLRIGTTYGHWEQTLESSYTAENKCEIYWRWS